MIVKRLRMENIRSYREADVEFPGGKTLFEGDIGSGKSTILMAIEFALFGLGSARASSLLRFGEPRGSVELEFEAGGRDYHVRRVLARKGGSIQQVEGKIRGPEGEEDYPPSEMKERILSILNFREPTDPRSRSMIYQYAIYTPQEEMKLILALPPQERVQILRRAFGVEEYKVAMENARELSRKIHEKKFQFEAASRDVQALKRQAEEAEGKAGKGGETLVGLERSEREQDESLRRLEKEKDELHEIEVQLGSASRDKKHLESEIEVRRGEVKDIAEEIRDLERKSDGLSSGAKKIGGLPSKRTVQELKADVAVVREDMAKHKAFEAEVGTKIRQYESVAERGKCPVCDREADPDQFSEMVEGLSGERKENSGHIKRLEAELQELEDALQQRRDYDALLAKAKVDLARAEEYVAESESKRKKLGSVRAVLEAAEKSLSALDARIDVLQGEAKGLESLRLKIDSVQREIKAIRDKIAELKSDVRKWREDARHLKETIVRKERLGAKGLELGEREIWLEEYFIPTVESIERHVMVSINREFGSSFQRWFGILVEDDGKEARVDEDFTPVVDQEGYEHDVEFLSGGERTSVALAYRLALSQMMQRFAEAGPSALILDEPTDGFSKEQLGKVREILDEMANPQVIIVSHERELESMADQIYRVAKVQGESKIA